MATTEYYTGADCTGSSGDASRVLTISNTSLTLQSGFFVFVQGLAMSLTSEYTVSHNATSTAITIVDNTWDDQKIIVRYVQYSETEEDAATDDFTTGPLNDFGVNVTRTPVTTTRDNITGDKTYTDGTDATIVVVFQNADTKDSLAKSGLTEVFDAKIWLRLDETISKYDKITYDSRVYRVEQVSTRHFNGTVMYKMANLFFIDDE